MEREVRLASAACLIANWARLRGLVAERFEGATPWSSSAPDKSTLEPISDMDDEPKDWPAVSDRFIALDCRRQTD